MIEEYKQQKPKDRFLLAFKAMDSFQITLIVPSPSKAQQNSLKGRLPKFYRVSAYRQNIHIGRPYRVISLTLKKDYR